MSQLHTTAHKVTNTSIVRKPNCTRRRNTSATSIHAIIGNINTKPLPHTTATTASKTGQPFW